MSDALEIPKKGVKISSPEKGWSDSLQPTDNKEGLKNSTTPEKMQEPHDVKDTNESTEKSKATPDIVAVGDALEQLFDTLNNSNAVKSGVDSPSWREVAELSRQLEEKLDLRKEILENLALLDDDLNQTRKELLNTLKKLGKFENDQLSAATVRASVSAMAIEVLAKKLS